MDEDETFSQLDPRIRKILVKSFSQPTPTEPQKLAIPLILEGKDVLLIAPTGSGKTEAAILPVFHRLLGYERGGFLALYITPLRALNRDMLLRLKRWGEELGISIEVRHGDTSAYMRRKQAINPPDMLITTPETIQAILPGRRLRENLKSVKHVIIDEVHELVNSKRGAQLSIALERIARLSGDFQRICLSATVGNPEEVARYFAGRTGTMTVVNASTRREMEIDILCPGTELDAQIRAITGAVKSAKSSLIFVNTRRAAEMLASSINRFEPGLVGVHHGSLSRETRLEAEDKLKRGEIRGLICTSSMELGIDIGSVDLVIQYASPREVTRLVQRVGRASHSYQKSSHGMIIALTPDDVAESLVIARRAKSGDIEPQKMTIGSLDVMAHQICGILLDYGTSTISLPELHSFIRGAYPYRDVSLDVVKRVVKQLEDEGLLLSRVDGAHTHVKRSRTTREYYYENLSMIPDEKRYEVIDIVSGKLICMLDERFVHNFATPGALFVARGETWRIVDTVPGAGAGAVTGAGAAEISTGERLKVEPGAKKEGEIPNWEGEEIPVPFDIAQEVGELRAEIASNPRKFADSPTLKSVVELIQRQIEEGHAVPTANMLLVELNGNGKEVVINACLGHLVNGTLGRVITALLGARLGTDIAMEIDPYRIKLKSGLKMDRKAIEETIRALEPKFIRTIIEKTLKNSLLFKWELLNVAKRFGALRKNYDRSGVSLDKLVKIFAGTPIYEETVKGIFSDKLDVGRTEEVVRGLKSGYLKVIFADSQTPIGASGYSSWRDVLATERGESLIIDALRNRIMNDRVILFCLNCKRWQSVRRVRTIVELGSESLICPVCNSRLIAALKPWENEEVMAVRGTGTGTGTGEEEAKVEKKRVMRVYRNANLVLSHGIPAVIALAARGIGPEAASRIIRKAEGSEWRLYRYILEAERQYTSTRRFWG